MVHESTPERRCTPSERMRVKAERLWMRWIKR